MGLLNETLRPVGTLYSANFTYPALPLRIL